MKYILGVFDRLLRLSLHPAAVVVMALAYFALVRYLDSRWRFVPFAICVTLVFAAVFFLASRRPRFSFYASAAVMLLQTFASAMKFEMKGYSLHIFDFVHEASDMWALLFVLKYYSSIAVAALVLLVTAVLVLWRLFRLEPPVAVPAYLRIFPVFVSAGVAFAAHPAPRPDDPPFVFGLNVSSLFLSLWHVPQMLDRPLLLRQLDAVAIDRPFENRAECGGSRKRPDIFLVLAESQPSPHVLRQVGLPAELSDSFRSGDGEIRPMFVEAFGAGTWMTNFSVLTGLSSADLQWQAPYVNQIMEGRVKSAWPDLLKRCGYRTVSILPMKYHTLNEGPFLRSLGFEEIHDADAMGIGELGSRDHVYFDFVERLIAEHRAKDSRPLFVAIQTIFPHSPYNSSLVPQAELADRYSDNGEINEYLRRIVMARRDMQAFMQARKSAPGANGSVLVEFGDHQSIATRHLFDPGPSGRTAYGDFRSGLYETFFAVHGFGTGVDFTKLGRGGEDAAYLAARVTAAANLPTSPVFEDLLRLSEECEGRFHGCPDRSKIDIHLRKRLDAGMLILD